MNKDQKLIAEAYDAVVESPAESGPGTSDMYNQAFKSLEDLLGQFYSLGQKGLGDDVPAINEKIADILLQHEVDERDMKRFADALTSILLGQSMRGFASRS